MRTETNFSTCTASTAIADNEIDRIMQSFVPRTLENESHTIYEYRHGRLLPATSIYTIARRTVPFCSTAVVLGPVPCYFVYVLRFAFYCQQPNSCMKEMRECGALTAQNLVRVHAQHHAENIHSIKTRVPQPIFGPMPVCTSRRTEEVLKKWSLKPA